MVSLNESRLLGWWILAVAAIGASACKGQSLEVDLRFQQPTSPDSGRFHRVTRAESWRAESTAVIVCDMWDAHHCLNAVRRVNELAPRIDQFIAALRAQGATVIHAPSSCMAAYEGHAARERSLATPAAEPPEVDISSWCDQIPSEETVAYPIDQANGGEDDDPREHQLWAARLEAAGRNPRSPWIQQCAAIHIDADADYISDSGTEIWNILQYQQIDNVMLVGVHTNMCVLGRPFGLRRLAAAGKHVVLVRDLTDTMYDPGAWPFANHFTGTDLIVSHIERHVCPTISSAGILGREFRFSTDERQRLAILIADDEYKTEESLPAFAAKHLSQHFSVSFCYGSDSQRNQIVAIGDIEHADALLVSARRRTLPTQDLEIIRRFVAGGRPVIGIRTASHAFSLRGTEPAEGHSVWPEFDSQVFGGNYTNHYGNGLQTSVTPAESAKAHPILLALESLVLKPGGSLYKTSPLAAGTQVLLLGSVPDQSPEPLAWTFVRDDGGRSFYTSLGHLDDFAQPQFETLLSAGIHWACGLQPHSQAEVTAQGQCYAAGHGRQRN